MALVPLSTLPRAEAKGDFDTTPIKPPPSKFATRSELEYDPLLDPHLKHLWSKKPFKTAIVRQGLATSDLKTVHSLKQKDLVAFHTKLLSHQAALEEERRAEAEQQAIRAEEEHAKLEKTQSDRDWDRVQTEARAIREKLAASGSKGGSSVTSSKGKLSKRDTIYLEEVSKQVEEREERDEIFRREIEARRVSGHLNL